MQRTTAVAAALRCEGFRMPSVMQIEHTILTGAYAHVPSRRLRGLARGEDTYLAEWLAEDTSKAVAHARHQAREATHRLRQLGARVVTIAEDEYPQGLLDLADPPPLLFVRGRLPERGVAIVGSRTPPPEAERFAFDLAKRCDVPVVSGLASGIDAAAHRGALEAGTPTLAYVGTGIGITYPTEHRALEDEIVARGGAIASERLPDEPVTKSALVRRDRLQAAHALAVVLVASELEGGAMHAMRFAKELNRPRFALALAGAAYAGNVLVRAGGGHSLPLDVSAAIRKLQRACAADAGIVIGR